MMLDHIGQWLVRPGLRMALLTLLLPLSMAACGGGGSDTTSAGTATIGAAGGTLHGTDGAQVVVPGGALSSDTTLRIAADSRGAPAVPAGLTAAGSVFAITPHGTQFAAPVQLRVPAPAVSLKPEQELKLAKAELNGQWTVLWDSKLDNGALTADIRDFSFVLPVVVTYLAPLVSAEPMRTVSTELDCGDQDCSAAVGPVNVTYRVTLNNGQLPSYCAAGSAVATMDSNTDWWWRPNAPVTVPLTGGTLQRTVTDSAPSGVQVFWLHVTCTRPSDGLKFLIAGTPQSDFVRWVARPTYPNLSVVRMPATLEIVDGAQASLDALFSGGASKPTGATPNAPTVADRAVIEWERSDDAGHSWRTVAVSYQNEANPVPFEGDTPWRYWSVRHGFVARAADDGALLRVRACYTPPDVAAPPCAVGPNVRVVWVRDAVVPVFDQTPRSVLVRTGQTASFDAVVHGTPTPNLQWQTRDANSTGAWTDVTTGSGAATATYTTPVLALADNGRQYRVVATNAVGSTASAVVSVSVSDLDVAPTITTQPANLAVAAGGDAVFAIAAHGTEALSYQWRLNRANLAGANGPVLKLAAVSQANAGRYSVVVSNAAGTVTSQEATLDVTTGTAAAVAPTIVTQPAAVAVHEGDTATFAIGVGGTAPYSYQWLKEGQPIEGATAAYYSLAATTGSAGSYAVRVSNAAGSVTSNSAALTVTAAAAATPVSISTQPSAQVQMPGASATFAVAASGTGPLSYQWFKGAAPISGATQAVLVLGAVSASDEGSYSVTVTNALGSVTSNAASLIVVGAPAITTQPTAATVAAGNTATFSVAASGNSLRYQWLRDGTTITGATASSYTTGNLSLSDNGAAFSVLVYNAAGVVFSQSATLTVTAAAPAGLTAKAVATGYGSSFAVDPDGTVWAWGYLVDPATGGYKASSPWATQPVKVQGLSGVKSITAVSESGAFYALHDDGTVSAWGRNDVGQLGDGTTTTRSLPVAVMKDASNRITGICKIAGGPNAMAMAPCTAGPVWMVGLLAVTNFGGDTGSGLTPNGAVPKAIPGLPNTKVVRALSMPDAAANALGSLIIVYDNETVYAWGQQRSNTLGAGSSETLVGTALGPADVVAGVGSLAGGELGRDFSIFQGVDYRLKAVGRNLEGQLGVGSYTSLTTPTAVSVLDIVSRFSVGQFDVAAIQSGELWVWGWNNGNALTVPTRLGSGSSYTEVAMGDIHGLAIGAGGVVYSWGDGSYGALGNGYASATLPVMVPRP